MVASLLERSINNFWSEPSTIVFEPSRVYGEAPQIIARVTSEVVT